MRRPLEVATRPTPCPAAQQMDTSCVPLSRVRTLTVWIIRTQDSLLPFVLASPKCLTNAFNSEACVDSCVCRLVAPF
jgi:hypothetical protein